MKQAKHKRKIYHQYCTEYMIQNIQDNHFLYANGIKSKYTIQDIIRLKKEIPNFKDYPTNSSLGRLINSTIKSTYSRIIWNTEEGIYDKWIQKYKNKNTKTPINKKIVSKFIDNRLTHIEPFHIVECKHITGTQTLHNRKPYEQYFTYKDKNNGIHLSVFSKTDVKRLKEAYENKEYIHLKDYQKLTPKLGNKTIRRLLATIITGRFNKFF